MELFRRTLAGMLMLVVAVSVGIWVQGRFIDAVRLPTHTRMIGATYTTLSDPFYETINDEIQMQIKSNGDLLLVRDPGQDQERQNQEIEDMLNMHRSVYRRYESGEREIPVWALIKLADYYRVSTDYLLGLTDDPARR